jgi:hypothetical protein
MTMLIDENAFVFDIEADFKEEIKSSRFNIVCKHWLRGLCKKNADCDYLHEYDLDRMPECWFYTNYGECAKGAGEIFA